MNKKILGSFLLSMLLMVAVVVPVAVLAQTNIPNITNTDTAPSAPASPMAPNAPAGGGGAGGKSLLSIVTAASTNLGLLGAGLATIAFIVAGIMYLMGAGNPSRMATAKTSLIAAVIGIVIIVLAAGAQGFVSTFFGLGK